MFRVFDACQPTVAQVRDYLERISGNSPFDLIFINDEKTKITKNLDYNLGSLFGVVIETTVFYTQVLSQKDNKDNRRFSTEDVFAFGNKIYHKAHPLNKEAIQLLGKNKEAYEALGNMLEVFGYYNLPPLQEHYLILEEAGNSTYADTSDLSGFSDGGSDIAYFLKSKNIVFCSNWMVSI